MLQSLHCLCGPSLISFQLVLIYIVLGSPELTALSFRAYFREIIEKKFGKDHSSFQCRTSFNSRLVCLGPYQSGFENLVWIDILQLLQSTCSSSWPLCLFGTKFFLRPTRISMLQSMSMASHPFIVQSEIILGSSFAYAILNAMDGCS